MIIWKNGWASLNLIFQKKRVEIEVYMNAELIFVGTELLLGDILNTNGQYISQKLAELGIDVFRKIEVGDNEVRLKRQLQESSQRADYCFLCGGLGSTDDDLTKEVLIDFCSAETFESQPEKDYIFSYFSSDEAREKNRKVYTFPVGAKLFPNVNGTASGFAYSYKDTVFVVLPGPPKEMRPMFEKYVMPYLQGGQSQYESIYLSYLLVGEYRMWEMVHDLPLPDGITLAPYAKEFGAILRMTGNVGKAGVKEEMKELEDKIRERSGHLVFSDSGESIEEKIVSLLKERKQTVSFAESMTAGGLAYKITNVPGSSSVLKESYVTYSNEVKHKLLNVSYETIEKFDVVSEEVAQEMAVGLKKATNSDLCVSITGYAGPEGKNVGTYCVGILYQDTLYTMTCHVMGNREKVRQRAVNYTLHAIYSALTGHFDENLKHSKRDWKWNVKDLFML